MASWRIVKFTEENDMVEAVPSSWIMEESGTFKCLWPETISGTKVAAAIRNLEKPNETWKRLPVQIMSSASYDSFQVATKKVKLAEYTSELDTESDHPRGDIPKRSKKRNPRYISSEEESSPTKIIRRSPRFRLPTPPGNNSQSHTSQTGMVKRNLNLGEEAIVGRTMNPSNSYPSSSSRTTPTISQQNTCSSCKDYTEVVRLLHIINGRITQNTELITAILNSRNENIQERKEHEGIDIDLPAKSMIDLMELDKKIDDPNTREFLVTKMLHVGGTDVRDIIKRIMPQLVDDIVLKQFSWVGGKGKKKFSTLTIANLIKEVCKRNPHTKQTTEKVVEGRLAIFLAKSTERCNRRMNKENKETEPDEELAIGN